METLASILLIIVGIYLVIGIIAYLPLLKKGIPSFDESFHQTPLFFKILIFPGVVTLWLPLVLKWKNNRYNHSH
jgi:hypothetical protein